MSETCDRCRKAAVALYRDHLERGVCVRCVYEARGVANHVDFMRRWRALTKREPGWDSTPYGGGR